MSATRSRLQWFSHDRLWLQMAVTVPDPSGSSAMGLHLRIGPGRVVTDLDTFRYQEHHLTADVMQRDLDTTGDHLPNIVIARRKQWNTAVGQCR